MVEEFVPQESLPSTPQITKSKSKIPFFLVSLVIVFIIAICGAIYTGVQIGKKQVSSSPDQILVANPDSQVPGENQQLLPTASFTDNWKTYKPVKIPLEFKLPPELSQLGDFEEKVMSGEKGTVFCASLPKKTSFIFKNSYAGAAGCYAETFGLGGTSVDFQAGRSGGFLDYQGYLSEGGKYYGKFVMGKKFEISEDLAKEVTSRYGVKVLRILGRDSDDPDSPFPIAGTPGSGWVGALVNLPSGSDYPGFAIQMKLENGLTIDLFDQILSTFKFTVTSKEPTADWKIFTSEARKYSIKYPSTYVAEEKNGILNLYDPALGKTRLELYPNFMGGWGCLVSVSPREEITVAGQKGNMDVLAEGAGENCSQEAPNLEFYNAKFTIEPNGAIWYFGFEIQKSKKEADIQIFKTILSTFKFLN